MKKSALFVLVFVSLLELRSATAQLADIEPGVERWKIKTTLASHPIRKKVPLETLLMLDDPVDNARDAPESTRITTEVQPGNLREGNIVTTTGWLHLVALERDSKTHREGDYHIQIRTDSIWGDTCFIVEVPLPKFIKNPSLRKTCEKVRAFIRERILGGKEPGTGGNTMENHDGTSIKRSHVYVTVKGQLFFDATHVNGAPRGKKKMKSYTAWEIHPTTSMWFAPKPKH